MPHTIRCCSNRWLGGYSDVSGLATNVHISLACYHWGMNLHSKIYSFRPFFGPILARLYMAIYFARSMSIDMGVFSTVEYYICTGIECSQLNINVSSCSGDCA